MKTNKNVTKRTVKVNVTKTIKEKIIPKIEKHGFKFEKNATSLGNFFFTRKHNKSEQAFIIGREKFGHSLYFAVGKQKQNGEFWWATPEDLNIVSTSFEYADQSDLENQIETILSLINDTIIPWLET